MKEIVALAKSSNYQLACQKHFDVTHPGHQSMADLAVSTRTVFFTIYNRRVSQSYPWFALDLT